MEGEGRDEGARPDTLVLFVSRRTGPGAAGTKAALRYRARSVKDGGKICPSGTVLQVGVGEGEGRGHNLPLADDHVRGGTGK